MGLEDLFLLYYLPFPPELLGPNKLFSPKGVRIDKCLLGNDLKGKLAMYILKTRDFQSPLIPGLGSLSLHSLQVGKQAQKEPCSGLRSSLSSTFPPLSGRGMASPTGWN